MRDTVASTLLLLLSASLALAETVDVKYRGPLDLAPFACTDVARSSFIRRVCFDKAKSYMVISLNGTYYHYCSIPTSTVDALMDAFPGPVLQRTNKGTL